MAANNVVKAQEAQGQAELVESDTIPKKMTDRTKKILESWGVQILDECDDLFVYATLPEGWTKTAGSHPMWSHLRDEQGRIRATMFYKAAFYDRSAHITTVSRYKSVIDYNHGDDSKVVLLCMDCETVLHRLECDVTPDNRYRKMDELEQIGEKWLDDNVGSNWRAAEAWDK